MNATRIGGILWSFVKAQVVYETNADLEDSYEVMEKNSLVIADPTEKGILWFRFMENSTVFMLSSKGKWKIDGQVE